MKYYTDTIDISLAEKLKEKGMPVGDWQGGAAPFISIMEDSEDDWFDKELGNEPSKVERRYSVPTYAEVFDWLMEKGISITLHKCDDGVWFPSINDNSFIVHIEATWHEAANAAIETALTLI